MSISELTPRQLYRPSELEGLPFATTDDFETGAETIHMLGQPRVEEALRFGLGIRKDGYNIFALGEYGAGKYEFMREYLDHKAKEEPRPPDICYVNNFEERHKPRILLLAPGRSRELARDMRELIENVRSAMQAAFENEEYQNRSQALAQELEDKQKQAFGELKKLAREQNMIVLRTPGGLAFAPAKNGQEDEAISPEEYDQLSAEHRQEIENKAEHLQQEAQRISQRMPQWQREVAEKQKRFNREVTEYTVDPLMNELRRKYSDNSAILDHLKAVRDDIVENVRSLFHDREQQQRQMQAQLMGMGTGTGAALDQGGEDGALRRYSVNVLVENSRQEGAPVVYEENPTYLNLFGRVEHQAQMGALFTDFNMIRPGALHRANGGYLILDALKVIRDPFAWEGLKRTLRSNRLRIESIAQMFSLISTVSLEPQPLPLDVKVVLTGPPMVYYLLRQYDPEFSKLFKVPADFAGLMDRNAKNQHEYARMIAGEIHRQELRPFERAAVARVIEWNSRRTGDAEKLSLHRQSLIDLLREADYWAGQNGGAEAVRAEDVQKAIDSWIFRSDRLRERLQEQIERDIVYIDTEGSRVGQINGLSVIMLGDFMFGKPSRITARIRLGKGEVIDIEREVSMGGPIHSKGVLILSGFLGGRYATDNPLSLSASLVFEQSYGGVDGDSASSAELYALLSAISGIPIKQSFAVTGSVNQHGQVQPIGGVNDKIEGFFDVCRAKGLTGDQGVLIPAANRQHLMLRRDVIEAVEDGRFHIFAVETIDQGIELLTGVPAGEPDPSGKFPPDSVNGKVHRRLLDLAETGRRFAAKATDKKENE